MIARATGDANVNNLHDLASMLGGKGSLTMLHESVNMLLDFDVLTGCQCGSSSCERPSLDLAPIFKNNDNHLKKAIKQIEGSLDEMGEHAIDDLVNCVKNFAKIIDGYDFSMVESGTLETIVCATVNAFVQLSNTTTVPDMLLCRTAGKRIAQLAYGENLDTEEDYRRIRSQIDKDMREQQS